MSCPELEQLERHLVEPDEAVDEHLADCRSCTSRLREISDNLVALDGFARVMRDSEPVHPRKIGSFTLIEEIIEKLQGK